MVSTILTEARLLPLRARRLLVAILAGAGLSALLAALVEAAAEPFRKASPAEVSGAAPRA